MCCSFMMFYFLFFHNWGFVPGSNLLCIDHQVGADRSFHYLKVTESKGRTAAQSIPTKKRRENTSNNPDADNFSVFSSRALAAEKDREELVMLKEQVEDLRVKLSEKDELLKSAEISKNQVNAVQAKLDELRHQASQKDSLIKSTQLQLSDAKVPIYCFCCFTSIMNLSNLSSVRGCECQLLVYYFSGI
jgi:hypothetical protein